MLVLSLLRHAKSSWEDPSLDDFDRPLAPRGIAAAGRMGAFIQDNGLVPRTVVCSQALRARQTLDLVLPHLDPAPKLIHERGLYLASEAAMLARVRNLDASAGEHVMLVGHDPGMHALARRLAGSGDSEQLQALARKFPTAALAVIQFRVRAWSRVAPAAGRLQVFIAPKMLG